MSKELQPTSSDNNEHNTTINTNTNVKCKQFILSQTARPIAANQDGSCSQEIQILFDNDSQ